MLEALNDWTIHSTNKQSTDVAYFDFSKAFDTVSHVKLFEKLKAVGLTENILKRIMDFLSGRTKRIRVGAAYSEALAMTSDILQGSCIGPILFVIYVNDMADCFDKEVVCSLYTDDIKLYTYIRCFSDCSRLQLAFDRLVSWNNKWKLRISINKCMVSHVGNNSTPPYTYSIQNLPLPNVVTSVKDLGAMFDVKLNFNVHINKIVVKALSRSYLIIKCFLSRDPITLFFWHLQRM